MHLEKPEPGERHSAAALASEARSNAQTGALLRRVRSAFQRKWVWSIVCALMAGFALRIVWIVFWADFDGDSEVYAILARNMLVHRAYALDNPFHLTLIRLPGYPVFMAAVFSVFRTMNYGAVRYVQAFVDMGSCLLVAGFVRNRVSRRAALVALWIACLCPFTANYTAVPLTECPQIFLVALGLFSAERLIRSINTLSQGRTAWLLLTIAALICAIGLRPDGILLWAAIVPGIWWYTRKYAPAVGLRNALLCGVLALLPLVPWTIRNYRVYHVFQPLAPRSAMDPTETSLAGYDRWTTTWEIDYVSLGEIWWRGDGLDIDIGLLPSRAFGSAEEYRLTAALIAENNELRTITPELDARFETLAEQRIHRHPFRQYVALPMARLADMWFRPRIEYLNDAVPQRWWEWRLHPGQSLFAAAYGMVNLLFLIAAAVGFVRRKVPLQAMLMAYVVLRCLVLLSMPNAEPRYTLEAFPIVIVAAAVAFFPSRHRKRHELDELDDSLFEGSLTTPPAYAPGDARGAGGPVRAPLPR